jgi:exodeoxyribonuclease VII small subunit
MYRRCRMADNDKFEKKLSRMEEISKALSDPETDLQKAVDLYEEGMKLANEVDTELSKIERRIEIVTSRPGESPDGVLTEEYKQSSDF